MLVALAGMAVAQAQALDACCAAVGAGACPSSMTVVGPSTRQSAGPNGTELLGLYVVTCDVGPVWMAQGAQTTARAYPAGTVLTPMLSNAAACFDATCRLPQGACLKAEGTRIYVDDCQTNQPMSDAAWQRPARPDKPAVVINGRVVGTQLGASTPSAPPPAVVTTTIGSVDPTVPDPPPDPCIPSPALRDASNAQVDQGNEAVVAGDWATAADRYRAAITINKCNAFAWTALGEALLTSGNGPAARRALESATRLMPTNFHAWTLLGQASEKSGDRTAAVAAYQHALQQHPGHPPATEGLRRLQ